MATELVAKLLGFTSAYPEDMFPPLTKAEIAELPPGVLDRASAAMGRHVAKLVEEAVDEIERLDADATNERAEAASWKAVAHDHSERLKQREAEIERLTAINRLRFSDERLQSDAARYRWLKSRIAPSIIARIDKHADGWPPENLDKLIDAYLQHPDVTERACKGGGKCPEPMWCGQENECLWDRWNTR